MQAAAARASVPGEARRMLTIAEQLGVIAAFMAVAMLALWAVQIR